VVDTEDQSSPFRLRIPIQPMRHVATRKYRQGNGLSLLA
jgi:hypothetical protein